MSKTDIKEWQKILNYFDKTIIIDGDFGKKSLVVSKDIAKKAGVIIPEPHIDPKGFSVKNNLLYYNSKQIYWKESEMVNGAIDPEYIVIHYTGTDGDSTDWLTEYHEDPVSAHLLVFQNGSVKQFAKFNKECWHAGKCNYDDVTDWNGCSIGIETQGTGKAFSESLMITLIGIISALLEAYPQIKGVIGHEHIATPRGRKPDPGPNFDWSRIPKSLV